VVRASDECLSDLLKYSYHTKCEKCVNHATAAIQYAIPITVSVTHPTTIPALTLSRTLRVVLNVRCLRSNEEALHPAANLCLPLSSPRGQAVEKIAF
jgi:hypothetical protein